MQTLQHTLAVPAGTNNRVLANFRTNGKVSQITLNFTNSAQAGITSQPVSTEALSFSILESADGVEYSDITAGSPIVARGGADIMRTIVLSKPFFQIAGKGITGKGGYARVNMSYEGRQGMGQIEVIIPGKAGYGFDGGTGKGQLVTSAPYPEGSAFAVVDPDPSSSSSNSSNSSSSSS